MVPPLVGLMDLENEKCISNNWSDGSVNALTLLVPAIYTNRTTEWHLAALYFVLAARECACDRLLYRLLICIVYESIFISSTLIFVDF